MSTLASSLDSVGIFRRPPDALRPSRPHHPRGDAAWLRGEVVRTLPAVFDRPGLAGGPLVRRARDALRVPHRERQRRHPRHQSHQSHVSQGDARHRDGARREPRRDPPRELRLPDVTRFFPPAAAPRPARNGQRERPRRAHGRPARGDDGDQAPGRRRPAHLRDLGEVAYRDELGPALMTAHPQLDVARGAVVNVATKIGTATEIVFTSTRWMSRRARRGTQGDRPLCDAAPPTCTRSASRRATRSSSRIRTRPTR